MGRPVSSLSLVVESVAASVLYLMAGTESAIAWGGSPVWGLWGQRRKVFGR